MRAPAGGAALQQLERALCIALTGTLCLGVPRSYITFIVGLGRVRVTVRVRVRSQDQVRRVWGFKKFERAAEASGPGPGELALEAVG